MTWGLSPAGASSQGGQDSNLQPAVLETAALPIEPPPYSAKSGVRGLADDHPEKTFRAQQSMADFNHRPPV